MSKLKKVLLMCTAYVLVAALAIGGTIAYLQDSDSDVNVMTLGNVSIAQHEYERVVNGDGTFATGTYDNVTSYELQDFTQGKPILPCTEVDANGNPYNFGAGDWDNTVVRMTQVGSYGFMQVFTSKNAQDKFVTVENTGKTDAYVRTIVAIEVGSTDGTLVGSSYHNCWSEEQIGTIAIDGNNYIVFEYVYKGGQLSDGSWRHENGILPAGDTSYPSLAQVYLQAKATNEDMEAIDGNNNGTLDILVFSQAVQAAGFADAETALDTAFGKTSEKAAEWFGGVEVPIYMFSQAEFDAAVNAGGNINLCCDVEFGGDIKVPTTFALGGTTMSSNGVEVANDFGMSNGTFSMRSTSGYLDIRPTESDTYTFTNVDFVNEYKRKANSNTGSDRIEYMVKLYPMAPGVKSTFVFENCTFENASVYFGGSSDKPADIDVTFKNCTFNAMMGSDAVIEFGSTVTGTVKIEGCTFNIEGTYANNAVIDIKTWSSVTLNVTATDNVLNANAAVPYTYDPAKGETEVDSVKIGNVSSVRNYRLFDCLTGKYSTIVETGTILQGEVAVESR